MIYATVGLSIFHYCIDVFFFWLDAIAGYLSSRVLSRLYMLLPS